MEGHNNEKVVNSKGSIPYSGMNEISLRILFPSFYLSNVYPLKDPQIAKKSKYKNQSL